MSCVRAPSLGRVASLSVLVLGLSDCSIIDGLSGTVMLDGSALTLDAQKPDLADYGVLDSGPKFADSEPSDMDAEVHEDAAAHEDAETHEDAEVGQDVLPSDGWQNSKSVILNGQGEVINLSAAFGGQSSFAVTVWFKVDNSQTQTMDETMISHWNFQRTDEQDWRIYIGSTDGRVHAEMCDGSNVVKSLTSTNQYRDGLWHFAVLSWNFSALTLDIDGGSDRVTHQNINSRLVIRSPVNTFIGTMLNGPGSFRGNIDEVSIWDSGLMANDIVTLYNSGSPTNLRLYNFARMISWWRMGDDRRDSADSMDLSARIYDQQTAMNHAIPVLTSGNAIVLDVP